MTPQFFVFCLPRSRSLWVANFLTWGSAFCWHEAWVGCRTTDDFEQKMHGRTGACGSDNLLFSDWIFETYPNAKCVYLTRSLDAINLSLDPITGHPLESELVIKSHRVAQEVVDRGGIAIEVDEWNPSVSKALWTFLLPEIPYPDARNAQLEFTRSEITAERWERLHEWAHELPSLLAELPAIRL
jgi:hypothetical protein